MNAPKFINLQDDAYFAELGWAAVARDSDGHAMNSHDRFTSDAELARYLSEAIDKGWRVVWLGQKKEPQ